MLNGWAARLARIAIFASLLVTPACCLQAISGNDFNDGGDAGLDAGGDAGARDSGIDAGIDAGVDAGFDAGSDGGDAGAPDAGGVCGPAADLTTYTSSVPVYFSRFAYSADMNGDGLLDLIMASFKPYGSPSDPDNTPFFVALGQPGGGLGPAQPYALGGGSSLAVGDLNGDGLPDVVAGGEDPAHFDTDAGSYVNVYLNDGDGGLIFNHSYAASGSPVAIGDVDGDGLADIVLGGLGSSEILYGTVGGHFTNPSNLPEVVIDFMGFMAVADLNGDGRADIVGDDLHGQHLVVLLSQGRDDFKVTTYPTPAIGQILVIPGPSGAPDLVLGEAGYADALDDVYSSGGVAVMTNAGDGTFAAPRVYTVPGGLALAIGDFNGDCIPDIATTGSSGCESGWPIAVLFGDGDGGYVGPELISAADPGPVALSLLGPVDHPQALATTDYCDAGVTIYGDSSRY